MESVSVSPTKSVVKQKLLRCADWLQQQNSEPKRLSFLNKNENDIQFIVETNQKRKNFMLSKSEDDASVPAGVDEDELKPVHVVSVFSCIMYLIISALLLSTVEYTSPKSDFAYF